jgi:cob(I)alamin adenosyltransferase
MSKHECVGEIFGRIDEFDSSLNMVTYVVGESPSLSAAEKLSVLSVIEYIKKVNRALGSDIYKSKFVSIKEEDFDHMRSLTETFGLDLSDEFVDFYSLPSIYINECRVRARAVERSFLKHVKIRKLDIDEKLLDFINEINRLLFLIACDLNK